MPATRGLTAAQLKYLAAFFIVVDHIGMLFLPMAPFFPTDSLWFYSFRYLGRLAFPIFAFFAAEGCRKTSNYSRHLLRLGLFGAVTHVVAYVATGGTSGSVIATFFLAAAAIGFCRTVWAEGYAWTALPVTAGLLLLAQLLHVDYGWVGVLTVLAVYAAGESRRRALLALTGCLLLYYLGMNLWSYLGPSALALLRSRGWGSLFRQLGVWTQEPYFQHFSLPYSLLMAGFSCLALLPLSQYNGQRGGGSRWFFYWFYPGHLVVLYALSMLMG